MTTTMIFLLWVEIVVDYYYYYVNEEGRYDGADDATLMMDFFLQFVNQPPFALSYSLASSLFSFAIYASIELILHIY